MKKKPKEVCKLCGAELIIDDDDIFYAFAYCPITVTLPNGRVKPHFAYNAGEQIIHLLPYKIVSYRTTVKVMTLNKKAKPDSLAQFKTVVHVPKFEFSSSEELIKKIRLIITFS
jgi:hypothetical protein